MRVLEPGYEGIRAGVQGCESRGTKVRGHEGILILDPGYEGLKVLDPG